MSKLRLTVIYSHHIWGEEEVVRQTTRTEYLVLPETF